MTSNDQSTTKQLQVGQTWRTRDGAVATITQIEDPAAESYDERYPVGATLSWDPSETHWYTLSGSYFFCGRKSGEDLVSLITEEPAKTSLQVGQIWRTRDGHTAVVTSIDEKYQPWPVFAKVDGEHCSYTLDGCFWSSDSKRGLDLVELIEPKFCVGQTWRQRGGGVEKITGVDVSANAIHPVSTNGGHSYTLEGRYLSNSTVHKFDLVELVDDASAESTPTQEPAVQTKPDLCVGQTWRDRAGELHAIVQDDKTERFPLLCTPGYWYGRDGKSVIHDTSPELELVELVSDTGEAAALEVSDATEVIEATKTAELELCVGQVWRDRNGDLHTIVADDGTDIYPLRASNRHWYTRNGKFVGSGYTHTFDLIELVSDVSTDANEAAKPQLRVNQVWLDRNGDRHVVVEDDRTEVYPCRTDTGHWYTRDGKHIFFSGTDDDLDLIKLVVDADSDGSKATESAPVEAAKPEFRVGQKWRARDGVVHEVYRVRDPANTRYPVVTDRGLTYTLDGRYSTSPGLSDCDLVELVEDVQPKPNIQVGQTWITRDGRRVKVEAIFPESAYPVKTRFGDSYISYTLEGRWMIGGGDRALDLVELASDSPSRGDLEAAITSLQEVLRVAHVSTNALEAATAGVVKQSDRLQQVNRLIRTALDYCEVKQYHEADQRLGQALKLLAL